MVQGVVSLLDKPHYKAVEQLWQEIHERFGLGDPEAKAMPHMSYHVAEAYETESLRAFLTKVGRGQRPFTITATGLGLFPGPEPTIYIPVARNKQLADLHAHLWPQLTIIADQPVAYYAPDIWFPHITLGHPDVTLEKWGPAIAWLQQQEINWTITIDNFYVLANENAKHVEKLQIQFSA